MKAKDVVKGEFIGLTIEVTGAKNPTLIGLKGKVIDETRNTFMITIGGTMKRLIKDQVTITATIKKKTVTIDGSVLVARPEDRIKKNVKL